MSRFIAITAFAAIAYPFAIIPAALATAIVQTATGLSIAEWVPCIMGLPLAWSIGKSAQSLVELGV